MWPSLLPLRNAKRRVDSAVRALRATRHAVPWLPHWHEPYPDLVPVDTCIAMATAIVSGDWAGGGDKGHPDEQVIRRRFAAAVVSSLEQGDAVAALRNAHRLAASSMYDGAAYRLCAALFVIVNDDALRAARAVCKARVVAHISCQPRLERASVDGSFAALDAGSVSQLTVVGDASASGFSLRADDGVLVVPAPDSYEHLPSKVVQAFAFLSVCRSVRSVLKVDDDHRLGDAVSLVAGFERAEAKAPTQLGAILDNGALGMHARTWHFGKTGRLQGEEEPFTGVGPSRWINGAGGYFVNAAVLRLMFWSSIYFTDHVRRALYEDMTVSDLIERQGGRLVPWPMTTALRAVAGY